MFDDMFIEVQRPFHIVISGRRKPSLNTAHSQWQRTFGGNICGNCDGGGHAGKITCPDEGVNKFSLYYRLPVKRIL